MPVYSLTGMKFSIGTALALKAGDFVAADFSAVVFTEVKEPETLGTYGDTFAGVTFDNVTDGRTKTYKGQRNASAIELTFGLDPTDAGQLALRSAFLDRVQDFAFRLELADKPTTGATPKNSTRTFVGKVMSLSDDVSDVGSVGKLKVTIQPNSNVVVAHASPT